MPVRGEVFEVLQVPSELEQMRRLYQDENPKRVLEIGCWDGGTLREWLTHAAPELVVAVDLEHSNREAYEAWRQKGTALHVYTGSSLLGEQQDAIRRHAPYDWALIDGDHSDHGVRTDFETVLPCMRAGGVILLHDITPAAGTADCPVGRFFGELSETFETWAFQDPTPAPWTRGIGVVRVPA